MSNLADASVTEGTGGPGTPMEFVVTLSQQCANDVSIDWTSAGSGAHPASGTDYAPSSGTVTIPAGHTTAGITVTVVEDGDHEDDETFTLTLTPRSGLTLTDDSATGTIVDDDPAGPTSGKIAFVVRDGFEDIHSIDPDGTDQTNLTNTPGVHESQPDWGYGTHGIVYFRANDIWAMDPDGTNQRPITTDDTGADRFADDGFDPTVREANPAWSPDYQFVAFDAMAISAQERDDADGEADSEIFVVRVATGEVTQVTHNERADTNPAWSPDGTQIAYQRRSGVRAEAGVRVRSVVPDPAGGTDDLFNPNGNYPDWGWLQTPAENWLLYDHDTDGDMEIYRREVGSASSEENLTSNSDHDEHSTWSPDGSRFAYSKDFEIYVQDATAGAPESLIVSHTSVLYEPDWGAVPVTAAPVAPPPAAPNPVVPISLLFLALGALGLTWVFRDGRQRGLIRRPGPAVAYFEEGPSSMLAGMPVTGSPSK